MCPPRDKRIKYGPFVPFFPDIPNQVEIVQNVEEKNYFKHPPVDFYDAPSMHLVFLMVWGTFYISLMFMTSFVIPGKESQNITISQVAKDQPVSSRKLYRYWIYQDTVDWIDNHIAVTTDCCVFRVAMLLSVVPMLFNHLISRLVWDVRHLKQGLEAGNLLSISLFFIGLSYVHLDTVSQYDWIYTFPTLLHYFMLSSSFSATILMNTQLTASLQMERPKAGEKVAKGALLYRSVHLFKWIVMIYVFIGITLVFLLSPLHPPWFLEWCDKFCWLTNKKLFFAFYAPVLSFFVCTFLAVVPNVIRLDFFEYEIREEPLTSIIIGLSERFHAFTILYMTWVYGGYCNHHDSFLLRETYSLIVVIQTFWYMSKPLENGFGNIFITPFYATQERLFEYLEEQKNDMPESKSEIK